MDSPWSAGIAHPQDDPRSVDELISTALSEVDEELVWDVIGTLHSRGTREVLDRASELCRSACAIERGLGADILGQLGVPDRSFPRQCLDTLLGMLKAERDDDVVWSILIAFSHLRKPDAIEPAARFRHHPNPDIRFGVVRAMTGHEAPLAIDVLIGLTRDPDAHVRDWATFGLGSMVEVDTAELREALAQRLSDDDDDTRCEAMAGLARLKDPRVIEPLRKALSLESVCTLEVEAAALIGDPRLHPELIALQGWWDVDQRLLEEAILACTPLPEIES